MSLDYKYLVFDTETTGLPPRKTDKYYSIFDKKGYPNYEDTEASNHCRLVSISWMVYNLDNNKTPLITRYYIIKPNGFLIPEESTQIHGITTEYAIMNGICILDVFKQLDEDMKNVRMRVAHNFLFDKYVMGSEMFRNLKDDLLYRWDKITSYCTMAEGMIYHDFGTTIYGTRKAPRLSELYYKIYKKEMEGAHNAKSDTEACAKCYQSLIKELD